MKIKFFSLIICLCLCTNCGHTTSKSVDEADSTVLSEDDISTSNSFFLPLGVKVFIDKEHNHNMNYKTEEKDGEIFVTPTNRYFDLYTSKKRMEVTNEWDACEFYAYPIVELFIVNNTDESLSIEELDMEVSRSRLDDFPYLFLFKNYDLSNCIQVLNESWSNWGDMVLNYRILRSGEKFNGTYDRKRVIPHFKDNMLIDFANDIRRMGFDERKIMPYMEHKDWDAWDEEFLNKCQHNFREGENINDFKRFANLSEDEHDYETIRELFYPFDVSSYGAYYYGFAWLYGEISFTNHSFKKEIKTQILITYPGEGGAAEDLDDSFNVQLDIDKENYVKKFPYVTVISPHDSERVRLHVRCDKSTHHDFVIRAKNSNGIDISTKPIHFYYLNTPHSYMIENRE